jgi:hypothetical protein
MIKLSTIEAEHILYTLKECGAALDDPLADYDGVRDCIESSTYILNEHFDHNDVEELGDLSEFMREDSAASEL